MLTDIAINIGVALFALGYASLLLVYFAQLHRLFDDGRLSAPQYFNYLTVLILLYLGGGDAAGAVVLNIVINLGLLPLAVYLIGLNVLFLPGALLVLINRRRM